MNRDSVRDSWSKCSYKLLSAIGAFESLRELDIEQNVEVASAFIGRLGAHTGVIIAHDTFSFDHLDGAW